MKCHKSLIILILISFLLFGLITGIDARKGCCSHHGGVCSYQCPNGGIGYCCCDGTPLSTKCAPYYAQCSDYTHPQVTTNAATSVTATSATLNANLISTGAPIKEHPGYISCEVWFEWGETTSYGYSTPKQSKSSTGYFSASITGLKPGKIYHFRAVASNSRGVDYGADTTFVTESRASSGVVIYAFDQNPAGRDEGNEWITLYNPSNESVDIGNWVLETADSERETIPEGTILYPGAYYVYTPPYQWLDNSNEAITLSNSKGEEVDKTPVVSDNENDNRYWIRNNSEWIFGVKELEKGEIWSGYVKNVVDGDTIDVSFGIYGIQRIRLVGVNTPEWYEEGYEEAKEFVNKTCLGKEVKLDVDDREQHDRYYRILAVVYVNNTNLNEKLLREGYAEIMYIPPSEFNPYEWKADYPSIFGTFRGAIKRFYDMIVHRVFTPSCPGTGGHTEKITFYYPDGTELANATWNGYSNGDYHWIEFDEPFKLKKNVNYTYEIKTGSYPKYIHNHTLKTSGEEITCLEFVDANGKIHHDWIPAIKLE